MKIGFTGTQIGFTGTQIGMSQRQIRAMMRITKEIDMSQGFHHGDCIGADAEAHEIVRHGDTNSWIVIHPSINQKKRAFKMANEFRSELPYLERNHRIVDETDLLIAAPSSLIEEQRSGTWATIRYARKTSKPVIILDR